MEAIVTIKVTPQDFDLLREALVAYAALQKGISNDAQTAENRSRARREFLRVQTVLEKIR